MRNENLTPWEKVGIARSSNRPNSLFYVERLFKDFTEMSGDRFFGDDRSIVGGIALFRGKPVTVIAQVKGKTTDENIERNFGMTSPEGYRKSLRLAHQAEKFNRPIITFIDTPGAYPGIGAEERGQASAIATNLVEFMQIGVPIVAIVVGEGGSGGALALSVSDHIIMLENSVYSILSPEGFASILWKDGTRAADAAQLMKLTAQDLRQFKIVDTVVKEPADGIHARPAYVIEQLIETLNVQLDVLSKQKKPILLQNRYKKFRAIGREYA